MWAWIIPFFTKHLWTIISVFADILIVSFVGYCVWLQFNPKPTTSQSAKVINNYILYPDNNDFAIGRLFGWELISHHSYPPVTSISEKSVEVPKILTKVLPKIVKK
jgi:hypothetical protein